MRATRSLIITQSAEYEATGQNPTLSHFASLDDSSGHFVLSFGYW